MNKDMLLEARNLRVKKGSNLILDVDEIKIKQGEFISIIGPNGAGKTTLLLSLCCLIRPSSGEVFFRGQKVGSFFDPGEFRRKTTMLFQEPLLFNTTVFENVASGLRFRRLKRSYIEEVVMDCLELFGIAHLKDRSARTLSGGEARRTALARAFAINPEILFLDEPFISLDLPTRQTLLFDLKRILSERKTTTLFATHDYAEALFFSDRFVVMDHGRIVQMGLPEEIMDQPVNQFISAFKGGLDLFLNNAH